MSKPEYNCVLPKSGRTTVVDGDPRTGSLSFIVSTDSDAPRQPLDPYSDCLAAGNHADFHNQEVGRCVKCGRCGRSFEVKEIFSTQDGRRKSLWEKRFGTDE